MSEKNLISEQAAAFIAARQEQNSAQQEAAIRGLINPEFALRVVGLDSLVNQLTIVIDDAITEIFAIIEPVMNVTVANMAKNAQPGQDLRFGFTMRMIPDEEDELDLHQSDNANYIQ